MKADFNSRRNFLKLSAATLAAMTTQGFRPFFNLEHEQKSNLIARIARDSASVYSQPNDESRILYQRYRDEIVNVYSEVVSEAGPGYNPLWYRVWGGYIHSAYLQRVAINYNSIHESFPEQGLVGEITVPFTQSMRYLNTMNGWEPVYRLYYESIHWVMSIEEGPDKEPWYVLKDELLNVDYLVPAQHVRIIPKEEMEPIAADVPAYKKHIEVSIAHQTLKAYEDGNIVLNTKISSGVPMINPDPTLIPTDTPRGSFYIQSKLPSKHMGDGHLTSDIYAYELPGVPWAAFFEPETGVAIHGTYWHHNFGMRMSRGCINMKTEEAKWLFRWSTPTTYGDKVETRGLGTQVIVT
jgi:hypothetical protein